MKFAAKGLVGRWLAMTAVASVTAAVAAVTCVTVATAVSAAEPAPTSTGDAANGKRLFMTYGCYSCHGTTGAGGGVAGPRLTPNPLPFMGVKIKLRTASGRMPVFSEAVLKDGEIADIYAYLASIPAGKSARDIPLLNH